MWRMWLCVVLALYCSWPVRADYNAAVLAVERGDLEEAKELARPEAEAGHVHAQFLLGSLGLETAVDEDELAEAVGWLIAAAHQGHVEAAYDAGSALFDGDGVPEDRPAAAALFRQAAEAGHGQAAYRLGGQYLDGDGVSRDLGEAERWYEAAAGLGSTEALVALHEIFDRRGERIPAIGSLLSAAARGDADASARLLRMRPAPSDTERRQAADWAADRWPSHQGFMRVEHRRLR